MMSGVLQDDDHVNQEDERPVWPIGFFNYQPPLLSHLNVGDEEVDQDEYACNRYAALGMGPKQRATHALTWREWQIAYLEAGYGTPEDPDAKLNPTPAPVIPTDETSDAAIARQIHEDELTIWRRDCISRYETEAAELRVIIAKLRARTLLSYSDGDEVEGASEQSRHHVPQDDDAETLNEDELEGRTGVKDADKQDSEGESVLHQKCRTQLTLSPDQFAASPDPTEGDEDAALAKKLQQQYDAENNLSWHRWQIEYLEAGHGTPEDPHAKPDPPASPAPIVGEISDAAIARQLHEEELAVWRRDRILLHAAKVPMLQARIASLSAELNDVMPGADTHDAVNGESQAPHGGDTASP